MAPRERGPTPAKAALGLPDRWLHCPQTGELVHDLFFPFKTPLCALYDSQIPQKQLRFHPADVFKHPFLRGRSVGLWVDLTNTDRYYFPEEVTEKNCEYKKLAMAGRGISPTVEETQKFIEMVKEFRRKNPDKVIGVHCTHGFNRTGFLIAAYITLEEEWGLDLAINTFQTARQGGIYKQDYINDLYERYDPCAEEDERIAAPEKPDWERESREGYIMNGNGASTSQTSLNNGNSNSAPSNSNGNGNPSNPGNGKLFMDGKVAGVRVCEDQGKKEMLQSKIQQLCKFTKQGFPGLQPVSLGRNNINMMEKEPYMVSWKADGMRYIVYINNGEVYAFDRDNEVFEIENLSFTHKDGTPLKETLVDTEVIIDEVEENGFKTSRARMLIYDIMRFNNFNVMKEPFYKRFEIIANEIIRPRKEAGEKGLIRMEKQIMSVRRKDFYDLCATYKLFQPAFVQNVKHEIDGLIFQPRNRPYETGRCDAVLKWKPPSHNSVDFLLKIEKVTKEGMLPEWIGYLFVQNLREPFASMKATNKLMPYNGKIIECTLEVDHMFRPKEWKFMRERTDKSLPNGKRTADNVLETMTKPVTQEYLLDYINHCLRVFARKREADRQHHQQHHHHQNGDAKRPRL